jgi:hypothetical protein
MGTAQLADLLGLLEPTVQELAARHAAAHWKEPIQHLGVMRADASPLGDQVARRGE